MVVELTALFPSAAIFAETEGIEKKEWLRLRKHGLGGSDAAAIIGLDEYRTAFDIYADKLGLIPEKPDNEAMRQGRDLEEYVSFRFSEATGKEVKPYRYILQHSKHKFMLANIDRIVVGENAGLECKTTSLLNHSSLLKGKYPPNYYVQCMHYMAVTGAEKWYLAVLVLGKDFLVFEIERDEAEIEALIEAEKSFWEEHVMKQIPPQPDGSPLASEIIKQMYSDPKRGETVSLFGCEEKIKKYIELEEQIKSLEQEKEKIKQELQLAMGGAEIGQAYGYIVEWKVQKKQFFDNKKLKKELPEIYKKYLKPAQTVRVFKIKKLKLKEA